MRTGNQEAARRLMDPRATNPVKFEGFLVQRWNEGFRNGRRLLTEVREQGYTGSFGHLERLLCSWRRAGSAVLAQKSSGDHTLIVPSPPKVPPIAASIFCMKPRGQLTRQDEVKVNWLKATAPAFATMRQLGIFRGSDPSKLDAWLDDAYDTGL
jgi:hypothetical protein